MSTPPRTRTDVKAVLLDHVARLKADRVAAARAAVVALAAGGDVSKLKLDAALDALQQLDAAPAALPVAS